LSPAISGRRLIAWRLRYRYRDDQVSTVEYLAHNPSRNAVAWLIPPHSGTRHLGVRLRLAAPKPDRGIPPCPDPPSHAPASSAGAACGHLASPAAGQPDLGLRAPMEGPAAPPGMPLAGYFRSRVLRKCAKKPSVFRGSRPRPSPRSSSWARWCCPTRSSA